MFASKSKIYNFDETLLLILSILGMVNVKMWLDPSTVSVMMVTLSKKV